MFQIGGHFFAKQKDGNKQQVIAVRMMFFGLNFGKIMAMNDLKTSQNIYLVGLSIHTSKISEREQLWRIFDNLPDKPGFCKQMKIDALVPVATCNRVEWLILANDIDFFHGWLLQFVDQNLLYVHQNQLAVNHVLNVACGLNSSVLGESPIFGQIRQSLSNAKNVGWPVKKLEGLMQSIFSQVKRIRSSSGLNQQGYSLIKAVEFALTQVFSDISSRKLLVLGAGSMSKMVLERLNHKFQNVRVLNRSLPPLEGLKAQFGVETKSMSVLEESLQWADAVICATSSPEPLVLMTHLENIKGLKAVIDLSVPRNVDPQIARLADVFLFDMDAVCGIFEKIQDQRQEVINQACRQASQVATQVYQQWLVAIHSQAIVEFRKRSLDLKQKSIEYIMTQVASGQNLETVLNEEVGRLLNQVMHQPTCLLRKMAQSDGSVSDEKRDHIKEYSDEIVN
jgi:glutamyl-tRNA reductase